MDYIVLDATNLQVIEENIAVMAQIKCSHDACGRYLHYNTVNDHEIAWPHGACTCTESGCDFTGPPAALVVHLTSIHMIPFHGFSYVKAKLLEDPVPVSGSPCRMLIGQGQDDAIFVLVGAATIVSLLFVRSASCVWHVYTVKMWVHCPSTSSVVMNVKSEACNSASPGTIELEDVTLFLGVPSRNLVSARSSKQLHFYVCIDKKDRP